MFFADRLTLDAPQRTKDGYLIGRARVARTGLYDYTGSEVDPENKHGLRDKAIVKIFRPGDEVFDKASLQSFIGKPIANDHPRDSINADNWRQHARGTIMGAVRDGEYVGFDYLVTDAAAVRDIDAGKKELSNGYSCDLDFTPGIHDGVAYDATQRNIRGNHLAIVKRGRAGAECRITDAALCEGAPQIFINWLNDQRTYNLDDDDGNNARQRRETSLSLDGGSHVATKTITFDGLPLEVTDAAEAAINKLQGQLRDAVSAKATVDTALADSAKELETEKGKVTALEQKAKDAALTPEKLEKMVADRATLIAQVKSIDPKIVTDGKTDVEIRRAAVTAQLGDAAKDMSDDAIVGAFAIAAKDYKPADTLRDALSSGIRSTVNDNGASVRDLARTLQY